MLLDIASLLSSCKTLRDRLPRPRSRLLLKTDLQREMKQWQVRLDSPRYLPNPGSLQEDTPAVGSTRRSLFWENYYLNYTCLLSIKYSHRLEATWLEEVINPSCLEHFHPKHFTISSLLFTHSEKKHVFRHKWQQTNLQSVGLIILIHFLKGHSDTWTAGDWPTNPVISWQLALPPVSQPHIARRGCWCWAAKIPVVIRMSWQ